MENQETVPVTQETVDYNAMAIKKINQMVEKADPMIFADIFTTIICSFLGVSIAILGIKKGYYWLMSAIRHAGN